MCVLVSLVAGINAAQRILSSAALQIQGLIQYRRSEVEGTDPKNFTIQTPGILLQRVIPVPILVPRGRDPFGQHRGSRPLAGSNFRVRDSRTSGRSAQSQDFCKMADQSTNLSDRSLSRGARGVEFWIGNFRFG